ncbi:hypothetical protein BVZ79_01032B, partial [Haemophilus influenzae]
ANPPRKTYHDGHN